MRASVDRDDPGYANFVRHRHMKVRLNGVEIDRVVMADEERSTVVIHRADERGRLVVVNGEVARDTLHGDVYIDVPGDHLNATPVGAPD